MLTWLWDQETKTFEIPPSNHVLFLDLPVKYGIEAMLEREETDIHESNVKYLKNTYSTYNGLCKLDNWIRVPCVKKTLGLSNPRRYTIDELEKKIWKTVKLLLVK